jgi:hypothetical protein
MLFHVTLTHPPEDCPGRRPEQAPELIGPSEQLQMLGQELGVTAHSVVWAAACLLWAEPEHVAYAIVEAPSVGAVEQFVALLVPPGWASRALPVFSLPAQLSVTRELLAAPAFAPSPAAVDETTPTRTAASAVPHAIPDMADETPIGPDGPPVTADEAAVQTIDDSRDRASTDSGAVTRVAESPATTRTAAESPELTPTRAFTVEPPPVPSPAPTRMVAVEPPPVPTAAPTRMVAVEPPPVPTAAPTRMVAVEPPPVPTAAPTRMFTVEPAPALSPTPSSSGSMTDLLQGLEASPPQQVQEASTVILGPEAKKVPGLRLLATAGPAQGATFDVGVTGGTVGRLPENDIHLSDGRLSRRHARIEFRNGVYWLSDLASQNGTSVNGRTVSEPHQLQTGDSIELGTSRLTVMPATDPND